MEAPPIPGDEPARLAALHELSLLDTPPEERFDRITRLAQVALRTPMALVSLVDRERQWFKSRQGLDAPETSRRISFCGHVVADGALMVVSDATTDPRFADNPLVSGDPAIRFYAGHPLRSPGGFAIGTLCVIDSKPRTPSREDLQILEDLSKLVELEFAAIDLSAKWARVRNSARFYEDLVENARELIQSVGEDGRIRYVNRRWRETLGYLDRPLPETFLDIIAPSEREHCGAMFHEVLKGKSVDHVETKFLHADGSAVPVIGSVTRELDPNGIYTKGVFRDATPENEIRAQLVADANRDALTGLPNRRALMAVLPGLVASARRAGTDLCVALVDLDHFKGINDRHGHPVGDRVLRRMGEVFRNRLRESDFVARYGGEEFCVLLPDTPLDAAASTVDAIRIAFRRSFAQDPDDVAATLSGGITAFGPRCDSPAALIEHADRALYEAKRTGRDRIVCANS